MNRIATLPRTVQQCGRMAAACLSVISAVRVWYQCDATEQRCAVVTSCETTATPHLLRTIVIHTRWRHSYTWDRLTHNVELRCTGAIMSRTLGYDKTTLSSTCACDLYTGFKRMKLPFATFCAFIELWVVYKNECHCNLKFPAPSLLQPVHNVCYGRPTVVMIFSLNVFKLFACVVHCFDYP